MISKHQITTKSKGKCAINHSTGSKCRLVHDGKNVLAVVDVDKKAKTESIYTIVEADTEEDCMAEIEKLKLKYQIDDKINSIKQL